MSDKAVKERTHWEVRWNTYKGRMAEKERKEFTNEPEARLWAMQRALNPEEGDAKGYGFDVVEVETHVLVLDNYTQARVKNELAPARTTSSSLNEPAYEPMTPPDPEPIQAPAVPLELDDEIPF